MPTKQRARSVKSKSKRPQKKSTTRAITSVKDHEANEGMRLASVHASSPEQRKRLRPFSNSRLVGVNTCIRWGVVSAQRMYPKQARALALEYGTIAHQMFAGVRIWQLGQIQKLVDHSEVAAHRIFGEDRWLEIVKEASIYADDRDQLSTLCSTIIDTSSWEDDPKGGDRSRHSLMLMQERYIDEQMPKMASWPIYVEDEDNPECQVGIEQVFDVVLTFVDGHQVRYVGTIDGLTHRREEKVDVYYLEDNKTSVRLDEGWRQSFHTSHQVTGYCAASTAVFGFPVMRSRILGSKTKPGGSADDFANVPPMERTPDMIAQWGAWVYDTERLYEKYKDDFENAPMYTHSCNRYFRPCVLIPFCCDSQAGRQETYWHHMQEVEMTPSELAAMD